MSMIDLKKITEEIEAHNKKALELQVQAERHRSAAAALEAVITGKFNAELEPEIKNEEASEEV